MFPFCPVHTPCLGAGGGGSSGGGGGCTDILACNHLLHLVDDFYLHYIATIRSGKQMLSFIHNHR